jgi:hypothetical protein
MLVDITLTQSTPAIRACQLKIKKSLNPKRDSRIAPSLLHPLSAKVAKVMFLRGRSSDSPAP